MCGNWHSVGWFALVGCVLAVLETCSSSAFSVTVGSAVVIGVASLLLTATFLAHATALGIAALSVDRHQFLGLSQCLGIYRKFGYCISFVRFTADLAIAAVS